MLPKRLICRPCVRLLFCAVVPALLLSAPSTDVRLAEAARRADVEAVRSLLKQKVDVSAAQGDGMTALHWAAVNDDLEVARLLIEAGADVKATTRIGAQTPLFLACTNGNAAMIGLLPHAGADPNSVNAVDGETALMRAAAAGGADAVRTLLDHGAAVNAKEK